MTVSETASGLMLLASSAAATLLPVGVALRLLRLPLGRPVALAVTIGTPPSSTSLKLLLLLLLLLLLFLLLCLLEVLLCSRVMQLSRPAWAPLGLGTTGDSRENFLGYGLVTRAKLANTKLAQSGLV